MTQPFGIVETSVGYMINTTTGALTAIPGAGILGGWAAIDPTGKFLYVAGGPNLGVRGYTINAVTGALTAIPGSPFSPVSNSSAAVAVDPTGKFVYVAGGGLGICD